MIDYLKQVRMTLVIHVEDTNVIIDTILNHYQINLIHHGDLRYRCVILLLVFRGADFLDVFGFELAQFSFLALLI